MTSFIDEFELLLLKGERGNACKLAVDRNMWAHALVLAANIDKSTYQDVLKKFTDYEFNQKDNGTGVTISNTRTITSSRLSHSPLKVLYSLYGNMTNASLGDCLSKNSLEDDQSNSFLTNSTEWREIVLMVLANRRLIDEELFCILGDQLASCGRIFAAHFW